jgi:glycosyltransferase involved in cell wall biosynthesis
MKTIIMTVTNDLAFDQRMIRICTSLSENGYKVILVGRLKRKSITLESQNFNQKRIKCLFEQGKLFYMEYNIKLLFYLLFKKFDIVCAIDLDTLMPGYIAAKTKGKHIVFDAHEYFPEVPEVIERPFVQKAWYTLERSILPNIDYAYTVSESIANIYQKEYKTPFLTIRNMPILSPKTEIKSISKDDRYILYQGALNEGRGLEELLTAMPLIDCKLVLAGEGDLSLRLRKLARKLKIHDKVKFLGFVPPHKLKSLTENAYIGFNVSKNLGLSYYYSLNNKFFDYIHAGLPSITNDFPEYRKLNEEFEVAVLIDLSVGNISMSMNELLENDNHYKQLKSNCFLARNLYNWENEEKKLLQLYNNID